MAAPGTFAPEDPFTILPGRYFVDAAFESHDLERFNDEVHRYFDSVGVRSKNAVIIGDIGKGKTHFLKHYLHELRRAGHIGGYVDLTKLLKTIDASRFAEDALVQLVYQWMINAETGVLAGFEGDERERMAAVINDHLARHNEQRRAISKAVADARATGNEDQARHLAAIADELKQFTWSSMSTAFRDIVAEAKALRPDAHVFVMIDEVEMLTRGNLSEEVELQLFNSFKEFLESLIESDDSALAKGTGIVLAVTGAAWHHIETKQPHFKQRFDAQMEIPDYGWEDLQEAVHQRLRLAGADPSKGTVFEPGALRLINKASKGNMRRSMKWCSDLYTRHLKGEFEIIGPTTVVKAIPTLYNKARVDATKTELARISGKLPGVLDFVLYSPRSFIPARELRATSLEIGALVERQILKEQETPEGPCYQVITDQFLDVGVPVDKFAQALFIRLERDVRESFSAAEVDAMAEEIEDFPHDQMEHVLQQLVDREDLVRDSQEGELVYRLVSRAAPDAWEEVSRVLEQAMPKAADERKRAQADMMRAGMRAFLAAEGIQGRWDPLDKEGQLDVLRVPDPTLGELRVGAWYLNKAFRTSLQPLSIDEVRESLALLKAHRLDFLVVVAFAENPSRWPDANVVLRQNAALKQVGLESLAEPVDGIPGNQRLYFLTFKTSDELRLNVFQPYYQRKGRYPSLADALFYFAHIRKLPQAREGPMKVQLEAIVEGFREGIRSKYPLGEKLKQMRHDIVTSKVPIPLLHTKTVPDMVRALRGATGKRMTRTELREAMRNRPGWAQALEQLRRAGWIVDKGDVHELVISDVADTPAGQLVTASITRLQDAGTPPTPETVVDAILREANVSLPRSERKGHEDTVQNLATIIQEERGDLLSVDENGQMRVETQSVEERLAMLTRSRASLLETFQATPGLGEGIPAELVAVLHKSKTDLEKEVAEAEATSASQAHRLISRYQGLLAQLEREAQRHVQKVQEVRQDLVRKHRANTQDLRQRKGDVPPATALKDGLRTAAGQVESAGLRADLDEWAKARDWSDLAAPLQKCADASALLEDPAILAGDPAALPLDDLRGAVASQTKAQEALRQALQSWRASLADLERAARARETELQDRVHRIQQSLKRHDIPVDLHEWLAYDFELKRARSRAAETPSDAIAVSATSLFLTEHYRPLIEREMESSILVRLRTTAADAEADLRAVSGNLNAQELARVESLKLEERIVPDVHKGIQEGSAARLTGAIERVAQWREQLGMLAAEARKRVLEPAERHALESLPVQESLPLVDLLEAAQKASVSIETLAALSRKGFLSGTIRRREP